MTDKQRNLILYLDMRCVEEGLPIRASDDDLLGKGWFKQYKNFTPQYASEVVDKLKEALNMPVKKKGGRKK